MKLQQLVEIVRYVYKNIYEQDSNEVRQLDELIYEIRFPNEKIRVDRSVGNRYRISFDDTVVTIEDFMRRFDDALGFRMYTCDTSNFIDLTESQITKIEEYYNL